MLGAKRSRGIWRMQESDERRGSALMVSAQQGNESMGGGGDMGGMGGMGGMM